MGAWINHQINSQKNRKHIMKNEEIYNAWLSFINEYSEYFVKMLPKPQRWQNLRVNEGIGKYSQSY